MILSVGLRQSYAHLRVFYLKGDEMEQIHRNRPYMWLGIATGLTLSILGLLSVLDPPFVISLWNNVYPLNLLSSNAWGLVFLFSGSLMLADSARLFNYRPTRICIWWFATVLVTIIALYAIISLAHATPIPVVTLASFVSLSLANIGVLLFGPPLLGRR